MFLTFHHEKGHKVKGAANNNRGMAYQTNVKHLTNLREYFAGVVELAIYCHNNRFLLLVFTNNHLKYLSKQT